MNKQFLLFAVCICTCAMIASAGNGIQKAPRLVDRTIYPAIIQGPALDHPLTALNESFEGTTFPPAGWSKIRADGGTGWTRLTAGTTPVPGWQGGIYTVPPGGGTAAAFCTWSTGGATSNDQWLVTPRITNVGANDSLTFYNRYWPSGFGDTMQVRISTTDSNAASFTVLVAIIGYPGTPAGDTTWRQYAYKLSNFVAAGSNIYIAFREKVLDNVNDGASMSVDLVTVTSGAASVSEQISNVPAAFALQQNYPNPFNPGTNIRFSLKSSQFVTLKVYNTLGQEVASLVNEQLPAGTFNHNWNASNLASGIYLYKLQAGNFTETRKLMLLK